MSRFLSKSTWLVIVLSLAVVGCAKKKPQALRGSAEASPAAENQAETGPGGESFASSRPGKLNDPLESGKDILALKQPGHWQVRGEDRAGGQWEGYLVIEQAPGAYMTSGYFEWSRQGSGPSASGRYHFEGTYDPKTRVVRWSGFTVRDRYGLPCNAHYQATLSPDGRQLSNGSWQGGVSVPGTWEAEFLYGP